MIYSLEHNVFSVFSDSSEGTAFLKNERLELVPSFSDGACMCWF
jgi:hypothetical protein